MCIVSSCTCHCHRSITPKFVTPTALPCIDNIIYIIYTRWSSRRYELGCDAPVVIAESIEARCSVENEDVDGAAPTGNGPTTSEWSIILLRTKVRLLFEVWRYTLLCCGLFRCGYVINSMWIHMAYLPIFFRVTIPALGQSYDCPSASEVILKNMGKAVAL